VAAAAATKQLPSLMQNGSFGFRFCFSGLNRVQPILS
jgi:hypothetical protein